MEQKKIGKHRGWGYRALVFLLYVEFLYVIAANFLLNTPLLQNLIDRTRSEIKIEYQYAYTVIPGHVRIKKLGFLLQDSNIQMFFTLGDTQVRINLLALLQREFHATRVKGSDLSYLFRFKRSKKDLKTVTLSALASIPGVDGPGMIGIEKEPKIDSGGPSNPWHIRLDGVDIDSMRELWFEEFHFTGQAGVRGGFALFPGHTLQVAHSEVVFDHGEVIVNGKEFLATLKGEASVKIPSFKVNEVPQLEIFKFIDGRVNLRARMGSLSFLNYYLQDLSWLSLAGGGGQVHSDIVIQAGGLQPNSKMEIQSSNLRARLWDQTAHGSGLVSWAIVRTDLARLALEFENYELSPPQPIEGKIQGKHLKIIAESPRFDLAKPMHNVSVTLDLPEAGITNLTYLNSLFPKLSSLRVRGGVGKVRAKLRVFTGGQNKDSGEVRAIGTGLSVEYGKLQQYQGDMQLKAVITDSQLGQGILNASGSEIQLSNFQDLRELHPTGPWQGILRLSKVTCHYGSKASFGGNIYLESSNARPLIALYLATQESSLPGWTENMLAFDNLTLNFRLDVDEKSFRLSKVLASGKNTKLKGWLKKTQTGRFGRWLVEYGPLAAGVELRGSTSKLKLHDAIGWYDRQNQTNLGE